MKIEKTKIKKMLKERLGRSPKENEITNAMSEPQMLIDLLIEKVEELEDRIKKLEK